MMKPNTLLKPFPFQFWVETTKISQLYGILGLEQLFAWH